MSTEIDFVIQRLESDLKKRGIKNEKQINNYIKEKKENNQLINGGDPINYDKIASTNTINQLENNFYQNMLQFKSEVKNYLDNINTKIFNIEKHLLKINLINDNYRDTNSRLTKVENDYKLFYNEFAKTNSICIENKKNVEYIKEVITEQSKENNILTKELKINMKNILNRQTFLEAKINENNNNNLNFEKKIIDKINNLYKEKEDILNTQSKNLISKIIENSNQYESKFELINNSISEIKSRIDNADNNINILNDIPNFKSLTNNINNQVLEINTKIEEISKFQKDIDENKNKINNLKNEIQEINSNIENINKFNNENQNIKSNLEEIKTNIKYIEKKVNIFDNNINDLDSDINENRKEIREIKKYMGNKGQNNIITIKEDFKKSNGIDNSYFNEELNKLKNDYTKKFNDIEELNNKKLKDINKYINDNFININKQIEEFNNDEIKINEENHQLMTKMSEKMIQNNKELNNIANFVYQKLEIINNNFKETNKYLIKVKELDKNIKDINNEN